jgi:hypothetical protein
MDIVLRTNGATDVQWMPNDSGWQLSQYVSGTANHAIVYSLNGHTLPEGETVVARIISGTAIVGSVMLVDAQAMPVSVAKDNTITGIGTTASADGHEDIYSVDGIKHHAPINRKGFYIVNGKKEMVK